MKIGYARVSTDGQSVKAQVQQLRAAGAGKVFRETASGAKTDRHELGRALRALEADDVLMVTRLDRLARSTRDLLNTLATVAERRGGVQIAGRHMGRHDDRARTIDVDGFGRACGIRTGINPRSHQRRQGARQSPREAHGAQAEAHPAPESRGHPAPRQGRELARDSRKLQCQPQHNFEARDMREPTL